MIKETYAEYAWEKTVELLAVDSPTGFTEMAAQWTKKAFEDLGYGVQRTNKGGLLVDLGGEDENDGLMLAAHIDTIGGMVARIKPNGRLELTNLGGLGLPNCESENVRVYTRSRKVVEGTLQLCNPSIHVNSDYRTTKRDYDTVEVVLDEDVASAEDTRALDIEVGDIVCFDPRTRRTASGYLKSRFLDDKLLVGITLAFAKYLKDEAITPKRKLYVHITVYEEVGCGGSSSVPSGVTEGLALDMGCVGDGLNGSEKKVSICAKDRSGPYSYEMVTKLVNAAKASGADYAMDVFPFYGSDMDTAIRAGFDIRHGLIGPGVYASHGYERSHMDGVLNTLKVLCGYLNV